MLLISLSALIAASLGVGGTPLVIAGSLVGSGVELSANGSAVGVLALAPASLSAVSAGFGAVGLVSPDSAGSMVGCTGGTPSTVAAICE